MENKNLIKKDEHIKKARFKTTPNLTVAYYTDHKILQENLFL